MHLFLVDASIYMFKAWFGPRRINPARQPNQALVGFCDFVYRLLTEQDPQHIVFAFDSSLAQSARKQIYPAYKANRSPAPDELKRQFGWCREWLEALGISCVSDPCWEADDLIGSLAAYHRRPDLPLAILTADKDLAQLIHAGDWWWSYLDDKKLDSRGIVKKFGVRPEQIAEQLALAGDKVDNIPGIPHVGVKTSARLLRKFGSLERLRTQLDQVGTMKMRYAAQVQQALIEHEELLDLSIRLTRINCAIEAMQRVEIRRQAADVEGLRQMMSAQGFDRARRRRWLDYLNAAASRSS